MKWREPSRLGSVKTDFRNKLRRHQLPSGKPTGRRHRCRHRGQRPNVRYEQPGISATNDGRWLGLFCRPGPHGDPGARSHRPRHRQLFSAEGPNPNRIGDPRIIEVYPAVASSTLDYVDLHLYPGLELTQDQYVQNFGFVGYQQQKPILMGEMGAFISSYPVITDAASALQNWQILTVNGDPAACC
jgi:hypothetical protein